MNLGVNDSSIVIRACSDPELTDISISDPLEVRENNISGSNILLQVRKASARLLIICKIAITTYFKESQICQMQTFFLFKSAESEEFEEIGGE